MIDIIPTEETKLKYISLLYYSLIATYKSLFVSLRLYLQGKRCIADLIVNDEDLIRPYHCPVMYHLSFYLICIPVIFRRLLQMHAKDTAQEMCRGR